MKQWKRLTYYLLLNVLVSVTATLIVLFIWDRTHKPLGGIAMPPAVIKPTPTQLASAPAAPVAPAVAPADANPVGGPVSGPPTPTASFVAYQVESGDTFESIADEYNISPDELIAVNGFPKSQPLGEGEVLRIPTRPQGSVVIDGVFGAGDLASERIFFKHRGEGEISVQGWQIDDGNGHTYTFPDMSFFRGGAVNLYTQAGSNTVVDLYWGLDQPIWSSGQTVVLKDAQGTVRASYTIP